MDAHARQQGSAYNGHYKRNIFLPLIASCAETGDMLGATLRRGNAHVAKRLLQLYQEDGSQAANGCGPEGDRAVGRGL